MDTVLPVVWFVLIGVLWAGYLFLEGFDLGVGMHMLVSARSEEDRRVMLNTIGPVWDGNEVWLLTAGGATFAAFPYWYASLLSTLYLPFLALLLALIVRAVAIEFAGKVARAGWRRFWDTAMGVGSFAAAFCVGAALALTTTGLPLDANGDRVGGPFVWVTWQALLGGLAVVGFCLAHASTYLALKTDGPVRARAARFSARWAPVALVPIAAWVLELQLRRGTPVTWLLLGVALVTAVAGGVAAGRRHEGRAFLGYGAFLLLGVGALFGAAFPVVLPSTLRAAWSLTVWNASSSPYTLGVMSVVAAFGVPLVLAYQAWSYWVFRRRIAPGAIPAAH
ncbi:cytochrome d ubiquinol oxidase subunit II [Amnibacterium sp.]|uniref:cytochrome d ubiquinol oxidase subunit II n=1 Tax=Amnibacterium sp. TaxID=1872496 RepID=UPI003F7CC7A3